MIEQATVTEERPAEVVRRRWRVWLGQAWTILAALLVLVVLAAPHALAETVRIPIEVLLGVALILVLPARARMVVATIGGVALGLLAILEITDLGFKSVLDRPFDPITDVGFLKSGVDFLTLSIGRGKAYGAVAIAVVAAVALLVLMAFAVRRLTRLVVDYRRGALRTTAVLGLAWLACLLIGVQIVPGVPVAAHVGIDRLGAVGTSLRDEEQFKNDLKVDKYRDTPPDQLLTSLRGKDVLVVFVESYGRVGVEDPAMGPFLDAGRDQLAAAGFSSRSAYVTSPTAGGGSWLAHSTLLSGLWVNNQGRYKDVIGSDRLTLTRAFHNAGWRTVGIEPATTEASPEGQAFYDYDKVYGDPDLGYRGPRYTFSTMPDQFALEAFQRLERSKTDRPPLMAGIVLASSHAPWAPVPDLRGWSELGDGRGPAEPTGAGDPADVVWQRDPDRVRTDYRHAVQYSMSSLLSYVETYGDDNLVVLVLGDHQPAPVVTGAGASRDAPISLITRDRAVLDKTADWGWTPGLNPGRSGPVWRMDTFRDRFLDTFS